MANHGIHDETSATGLDEAIAPAPVENAGEHGAYHRDFLEDNEGRETEKPKSRRGRSKRKQKADSSYAEQQSRIGPKGDDVRPFAKTEHDARSTASTLDRTDDQISSVTTKIFTIGHLVFFSIMGTLARLGLQALTVYPQAPISQGLVWANVAGSFIMGYLSEERALFREEWGSTQRHARNFEEQDAAAEKKRHAGVKKTIPLFIGLATGFCGSFTSFSSFQRDVFLNLANSVPYYDRTYPTERSGGYSFLALLAALIITPALSLAALSAGAHLAVFTERFTPTISFNVMRGTIDPLVSFLGFGCWLGAVIMAILPPDRPHGPANDHHGWARETWRGVAIFALVFAPVGALTRYYVSMWLNPRIASFPLGTFSVNMFGTLMETLFYDLQHAPLIGGAIGGGLVGCQVLQGLQDGFCGCLTTVSTWVAELKGLRRSHAYVYGLSSLLVGLATTVVVMGSLRWTIGFAPAVCDP